MSPFTAIPISLKQCSNASGVGVSSSRTFTVAECADDDRIKGLSISISRGFPVGAVVTLDAGGDIRFQSRLIEGMDGNEIQQVEEFLLDGQQRFTSLFQAMLYGRSVEIRDRPGGSTVIKRWYCVDIRKILDPLVDRDDKRDRFDKSFVERGRSMLDLVNQAMRKRRWPSGVSQCTGLCRSDAGPVSQ